MQVPVVGLQPLRSVEQPGTEGHFRCLKLAALWISGGSHLTRCLAVRLGRRMVFVGYQVLAFCDWQRRRCPVALVVLCTGVQHSSKFEKLEALCCFAVLSLLEATDG